MIVLLLTLLFSFPAQAQGFDGDTENAKLEVLRLINEQRANLGIAPVERSFELEDIVGPYTAEMALGLKPWGHGGLTERCKLSREAIGGNLCGEILAWGHDTPKDVHVGWTNSPGHYKAMVQPRYTHAGVAYVVNAKGRPYWSVLFLERH